MPIPIIARQSTRIEQRLRPQRRSARPMTISTNPRTPINPQTTIEDLLTLYPDRAPTLLSYRLPKVGKSEEEQAEAWTSAVTIEDAARTHGLSDADLAR